MPDAATALVDRLAGAGVRRVYTVPGESFLPILDAVEHHPDLRLVSTRHESGAGFMAEAEASLTGRPAVAMASRGPGASNLAIAVHAARQSSTPMVVLLGQVSSAVLGREAFQEVDLAAFYAPIAKWAVTATRAESLPFLVEKALHVATSGRPGPVAVAIPADLPGTAVSGSSGHSGHSGDGAQSGVGALPGSALDVCAEVARRLAEARAPVVIAGGGARWAGAELVALSERLGLGVYSAFRRQDVFPNDHPNYLGHLGLGTPPEVLAALEEADLVLVLGCRLSEVTTQGYRLPRPGTPVAQVDIDPEVVGSVVPVELRVVAPAREGLLAMLARAGGTGAGSGGSGRAGGGEGGSVREWAGGHRAYLDWNRLPEPFTSTVSGVSGAGAVPAGTSPDARARAAAGDGAGGGRGIHPAEVVATMARMVPADAIVANDAGNFAGFLHRYWRYNCPHSQLAPTSGAMGYGVPAAVAAKLAAPDRPVIGVVGDGGLLMTGQELETAARLGLPLVVVAFHNALYGTIAMHQARTLGRTVAVDLGSDLDLATWARGLGAKGWRAEDGHELEQALAEAMACGAPALVDVVTDPDVISSTATLSGLLASARVGGSRAG